MASQRISRDTTSHEIIDANGVRQGFYSNKSAASRALNRSRRDWDAVNGVGRHSNPHTHTLRPAAPSVKMYVIKFDSWYVAGYNAEHMIVVTTSQPDQAKRFATMFAADRFITQHGDTGEGLSAAQCTVVEVQ